jgi:hypothetical protein
MLEGNGFEIETQTIRRMWVPVEIVLGTRAEPQSTSLAHTMAQEDLRLLRNDVVLKRL